jgi:hypothetical protein
MSLFSKDPGAELTRRMGHVMRSQTRESWLVPLLVEAAAESLRELGADDIRTFSLRQGSDGPDTFPPGGLVVVDIRFVGHSQSGIIADRTERSEAQDLAVRSGKGSLARTVAGALRAH